MDPLQPPKFKHKKVPRGPGSPPVPVMHSPPRKVTAEDMASWKIPPCISNWKNARGYTIPLDKRLAADGRGLQETTINSKFAKLSESLYIAERKARKEVELRAQMRRDAALQEKSDKEEELRALAAAARAARAGRAPLSARDGSAPRAGAALIRAPPPWCRARRDRHGPPARGLAATLPAWMTRRADQGPSRMPAARRPLPRPGPNRPTTTGGGGRLRGGRARGSRGGAGHLPPSRRTRPRPPGPRSTPGPRPTRARGRRRVRGAARIRAERSASASGRSRESARGGKRSKTSRDHDRTSANGSRWACPWATPPAPPRRPAGARRSTRVSTAARPMDAGFGADDAYNTYDKALFSWRGSASTRAGRRRATCTEPKRST